MTSPARQIIQALSEHGWLNITDDRDYADVETVVCNVLLNGFRKATTAIRKFKQTRGRHEGPHDAMGGTICAKCEIAYVEAEEELDSFAHDEDCPCYGDRVEHSKDCANCECDN